MRNLLFVITKLKTCIWVDEQREKYPQRKKIFLPLSTFTSNLNSLQYMIHLAANGATLNSKTFNYFMRETFRMNRVSRCKAKINELFL